MAAAGVAAAAPAMAAPGPAVLWVAASGPAAGGDGSSCGHPGFTTIQAAISAAPTGASVAVCAGTYPEQLQITKSVSVRAVGQVTVTLPPVPANSGTACDTAVSGHTGLPDQVAVVVCGPVSVSLTGLTINAAWPSATGCGLGLYALLVVGGSTVTFADSAITSAGTQPINGCQNGIGIRAGVPGTSPLQTGHLTLRDSGVSGYDKGGVVVSAPGSTALISGATVRGAGATPVIAQNGIQVSGSAKATIAGTTVSGNECDDQAGGCGPDGLNDTQSAGILLFGSAAGTSVTGSTLHGNDIGVYCTPDAGPLPAQPGAVLAEDSFTANRYEGVVFDQGNARVDASVFTGGNVGIEVLQYSGQVLRNAETASLDRITGMRTATVEVASDRASSGDLPGSFQISLSATRSAPVLDNSTNLPVIQRADF